jgi:hypothetical protein
VFIAPRKQAGKFKFRIDGDGRVYKLPYLQHIDPDFLMKFRRAALRIVDPKTNKLKSKAKDGDIITAFALVRELFERYVPGLYDTLDPEQQIMPILDAWQSESGATMGESSASST